MEKLKKYKSKRDFSKTQEPSGDGARKGKKKIFVVQHHYARSEHYDFRLEHNGVLVSFAVPKGPSFNPKDKRLAVHVENHPLDYATFEGNIPKGQYGGGSVMLWDEGTYKCDNFGKEFKAGAIKFTLFGKRLKGKFTLVHMKDENWLLIKENDEFVKKTAGISQFKTSIKTGRTIKQIAGETGATKNPLKSVSPMLATLVGQVPSGNDYAFEIKYDGYRGLAFVEGGKTKLFSRNKLDFSKKFPSLVRSLTQFLSGHSAILDGEIIVQDERGRSNFQALQNGEGEPIYMVFDLVCLDGEDFSGLPLLKRKERLEKLLQGAPENICYSSHIIGNGKKFFAEVQKLNLEGIVGKKIDSPYQQKRSEDWIKIKCYKEQEFVAGGFTQTHKRGAALSSLLLGVYQNGKLKFVGKCGTGFNDKNSKMLKKHFKIVKKSPFVGEIKENDVVFIKPIVVEIQYAEMTKDGILRQASYKGLREDKTANEVELESPKNEICGVEISNPDKLIFKKPKISKFDIAQYYQKVAPRILQIMGGRLLSVVRCHGDIKNCFYKKHPIDERERTNIVKVKNDEGEMGEYFFVQDEHDLLTQVQLGTLEFHIWGSKVGSVEKPDLMVFDLDPDKKLPLEKIRQGVKDLKKVLDALKLKSFIKTSGGKGYHIVVPFESCPSWQKFHDFAEKVAKILESKFPDRYTTNIRKNTRGGKIFIDFLRNTKGATSVAPYSLRARDGAKVSMPIAWSEVDKIAPNEIDIFSAVERLKRADPWKDIFLVHQKLQ